MDMGITLPVIAGHPSLLTLAFNNCFQRSNENLTNLRDQYGEIIH